MNSQAPVPRLELCGISKSFPGVLANDRVSLAVLPGEIHALLGENGAGKSTLVKIADGLMQPDSGEIRWDGKPVHIAGPKFSRRLGIGMVFQHFSLFEALSVAENVALGISEPLPMAAIEERIEALSREYGLNVSPRQAVHQLSMGERQRVEILRCLVERTRLLILDEPTSVLTPQEASGLFVVLRKLAVQGCSIIYISHKLHEVRELCDRATVLRRGRRVATCTPADESPQSLARMMIGDDLKMPQRATEVRLGEVMLKAESLCVHSAERFGVDLQDINFSVRRGEILGIAGVAGNGQRELLAALSGEQLCEEKRQIEIGGQAMGRKGPRRRRAAGLACIPEDRLGHGTVPAMMLAENAFLSGFGPKALTRFGLIRTRARNEYTDAILDLFDVQSSGIRTPALALSGGNLQKFITGRELLQSPDILIAAHPTWGVDAGAAAAIHQALLRLAEEGSALVIISNELDELLAISDRIAVMARGRLSRPQPVHEVTAESLGLLMAGANSSATAPDKEPQHVA